MPGVILLLGPVAFEAFEVRTVSISEDDSSSAVHQLTDGRRIVDSIGSDDFESPSGHVSGAELQSAQDCLTLFASQAMI